MRRVYTITFGIFIVGLLLTACSTKKNAFLNRNLNAVSAEFNKLYNGQVAFDEGQKALIESYRDNYWKILPIERLEVTDEVFLPGESKNPSFELAEEKAAKAIQKNSMYIGGKEYNPQMDEAFILLGKARYFDQRFIPALEAFNYILAKYPTSDKINVAKVWKAKANIRLQNEEVAIDNLDRMLKNDELEKEDVAEAASTLAQAFINLDTIEAALPYIKMASEFTRDNTKRGRYLYIKGQLYNALEHKDSANLAFDEVIELNRKSPRIYMINAYIEKAKNFDYQTGDKEGFLALLTDLEEDRENRPYLDKIYNQIGIYHQSNDSIDLAIDYYNMSIKKNNRDDYLQAVNYVTLGDIYFDKAEYKRAGAYFDSTLLRLSVNTIKYRRIKKKRDNLDDVILYEDIATGNDSILRLVNMSDAERLSYFTDYTSKLKAKAIADSIALAETAEGFRNDEFFQSTGQDNSSTRKPGAFYFYNATTVAYGKQAFAKRWGDRELEDDWRRSNKKRIGFNTEDEIVSEGVPISDDERFKPETYISRIPSEAKVIDSLVSDRNFAYYQLGLIYKEKFKEYQLAANRLEKLLQFNPEERLILPSKYNLYKIYLELDNASKAAFYKNDIVSNYADSRYAEILNNPNAALATDESSPEYKYTQLYKEFLNSNYQEVIDLCDQYISTYFGNEFVPKFELLKATALGRQEGYEAYKKALNFVSLNYPNTDEGKKAQLIYSTTIPKLANKEFLPDDEPTRWNIVYEFDSNDLEGASELQDSITSVLIKLRYDERISVSTDFYTKTKKLVVIHGLDSRLGALGFALVLKEYKELKFNKEKEYFAISSSNYKIIQIHKNLDAYLSEEETEDNTNPQN